MGISVVSAASLKSPGKGAASSPLPVDGGGADFAALLTQQLAGPDLLGLQLDPLAGTGARAEGKDTAGAGEEGTAASIDVSALLAAAGLAAAPQKPVQADAANVGKEKADEAEGQIPGIVGQLGGNAGKGLDMEGIGEAAKDGKGAALAADMMRGDAANLAADAKPASGEGQNFAATLAAHGAEAQRTQVRNENGATATVSTPLHDSRWSQDFGEKIVWLAKSDQQTAQLNINPPQLGPMQITLSLNGDQASALFVSAHAEVRQAIQEAMPQLREMLAGAGINLGQANVGAQLAQQNGGEQQPRFSGQTRADDDKAILRADNGTAGAAPLTTVRGGRGMVDLFA